MKKLPLNKDYSSINNYNNLIDDFLKELKEESHKNHQKIIELCHVGKFLMFFENEYKIEKLGEEPDFILTSREGRIGLEHQILVDKKSREKEGFFDNLCRLAERELKNDKTLPNFLANIYANPFFDGKVNNKQKLVNEICQIVKTYIQTGELLENEIIDAIFSMDHSQISLSPNLGAWWQKEIKGELIKNAVEKKEGKIYNYLNKANIPQWLLIVIGGVGESSYIFENDFDLTIETKFNKVFILEDFSTNLYEIK